ncbi:universal stress protein [Botryobacter ruber]|uniref:universal stress protein n=1 Tax=Botryobacter ruber TaxID=2171629 RepID=UPI000E0AE1AA|nr:universal stress protein [Botryobacter ruber]
MKTILVPLKLDSPQDCSTTLLYALHLARLADLQVVVFNAFSIDLESTVLYEDPKRMHELEKEKARELEERIHKMKNYCSSDIVLKFNSTVGMENDKLLQHPVTRSGFHTLLEHKDVLPQKAVNITCVCKSGAPYEQIMCATAAYDADLIVMGMLETGVAGEPVIRSTTLSVMRHSRVPVIGVPKGRKFNGLKSVVYASDLLNVPEPVLLQKLRDFVNAFRCRLHVLHLHQNKDLKAEYALAQNGLDMLDRELYDVSFHVIFQQKEDLDADVLEYVYEQKADLLILSPNRHTFIEKLLNQSLTQRLMAKIFVPIMALPAASFSAPGARPAQAKSKKTDTF